MQPKNALARRLARAALLLTILSVCLSAAWRQGLPPGQRDEQAAPAEQAEPAKTQRYQRILVVNDDGIDSPGLAALVAELARSAEVWVCAPDGNRSGASASSDGWGRPMSLAEREIPGAVRACAVGGKPVDATHFGLYGMLDEGRTFDLVVSGINDGANVGTLAHYSGTVGAAMAAAHAGVPAVAISQHHELDDYALAARFAARFVDVLREHGARVGTVYSINVPKGAPDAIRGVAPARMGGDVFKVTKYVEETGENGAKTCRGVMGVDRSPPPGSDAALYGEDRITVTPLAFDWTDDQALAEVAGWTIPVE